MSTSDGLTAKARAVLDTAARLFYDRGITAVGVDLIAAQAGVTKKTLYDRFGNKQRLVTEYLADRDRQWCGALESARAQADSSPFAQLTAVFDAAAAWAAIRGHKGCAMVNAHAEISDPDHPAYAVIVGQKARMLAMFTDIASAAGHPDPDGAGAQIMLLHEGAVVASGMGTIRDAFARAAAAALAILDRAPAQRHPARKSSTSRVTRSGSSSMRK